MNVEFAIVHMQISTIILPFIRASKHFELLSRVSLFSKIVACRLAYTQARRRRGYTWVSNEGFTTKMLVDVLQIE
jgi:hypothetical protein